MTRRKKRCPECRHWEINPLYVRKDTQFKPLEIREDENGKEDYCSRIIQRGYYCVKCKKIIWVKEYSYR